MRHGDLGTPRSFRSLLSLSLPSLFRYGNLLERVFLSLSAMEEFLEEESFNRGLKTNRRVSLEAYSPRDIRG